MKDQSRARSLLSLTIILAFSPSLLASFFWILVPFPDSTWLLSLRAHHHPASFCVC